MEVFYKTKLDIYKKIRNESCKRTSLFRAKDENGAGNEPDFERCDKIRVGFIVDFPDNV